VGAGPEPLTRPMHDGRVPSARPFDDRAAARAGGGLAGWLAGCTGDVPPRVAASVVDAQHARERAMPSVGHVARAVDEGRERAAQAAADGCTVLVVASTGSAAAVERVDAWLGGAVDEIRGPLGALWRLGDEELAVLCGAALGAGEQGLAVVCAGAAGTAAARLAVAVQPDLGPRVRAAGPTARPDRLRFGLVLDDGSDADAGADAAVAALDRACAAPR
jgi:NaMN:DMB phosphoribosyltransferase